MAGCLWCLASASFAFAMNSLASSVFVVGFLTWLSVSLAFDLLFFSFHFAFVAGFLMQLLCTVVATKTLQMPAPLCHSSLTNPSQGL